jgi:RimJ/RimL family protein N-acetyltransferase
MSDQADTIAHTEVNRHGQAVGVALPDWRPCDFPPPQTLAGRHCTLEALDAERHAQALFEADAADVTGESWTYLPYGPFPSFDVYRAWAVDLASRSDPQMYAVLNADGRPVGVLSLMRLDPANGVAEIGHVHFSPSLQRSPAATEAVALLLRRVFELGYRRCEWKCDALNQPSRRAALRLGFAYEGLFRQAMVIKGRNRDTTWFSIIDSEWPLVAQALDAWLAPANFDAGGHQRHRLAALREALAASLPGVAI